MTNKVRMTNVQNQDRPEIFVLLLFGIRHSLVIQAFVISHLSTCFNLENGAVQLTNLCESSDQLFNYRAVNIRQTNVEPAESL